MDSGGGGDSGGGDSGGCVRKFGDSEWSMWSEYEYCIIISGP